jgi:hypothetical protein
MVLSFCNSVGNAGVIPTKLLNWEYDTLLFAQVPLYCDMSTLCWITQRSVARQPTGKQDSAQAR